MQNNTSVVIGSSAKVRAEEVSEALLSELEAEFAKIKIPKRNGSPVK